MSTNTGIEWTDATWNPMRGCSRVSEGCRNCYAERMAARFARPSDGYDIENGPFYGFVHRVNSHPAWTGKVELIPDKLLEPLSWRKPRRIFVNSMSDLFHEALPDSAIDQVFAVMALCPQHTFQVLTKRPERMREYLDGAPWGMIEEVAEEICDKNPKARPISVADLLNIDRIPLPNVWLGVSVEDQGTCDERVPVLLKTPSIIRFVSYEPALGPVGLISFLPGRGFAPESDYYRAGHPPAFCVALDGTVHCFTETAGPGHAAMVRVGKKLAGRELDGREWSEFPK